MFAANECLVLYAFSHFITLQKSQPYVCNNIKYIKQLTGEMGMKQNSLPVTVKRQPRAEWQHCCNPALNFILNFSWLYCQFSAIQISN